MCCTVLFMGKKLRTYNLWWGKYIGWKIDHIFLSLEYIGCKNRFVGFSGNLRNQVSSWGIEWRRNVCIWSYRHKEKYSCRTESESALWRYPRKTSVKLPRSIWCLSRNSNRINSSSRICYYAKVIHWWRRASKLHLFRSQGNFWNRLTFVNICLMLFEEINEKLDLDCGFLKTVPGCRVCRISVLKCMNISTWRRFLRGASS